MIAHFVGLWVDRPRPFVSAGRVFLGLHYPTDVLADALLGAGTAVVLWWPPLRGALSALADRLGALADAPFARLRA